ncbi:MAG: UDP-N-acetylglucosamine 2-epimerase, partial [Candidatus Micrarchaeia archaeon]
SGSMQEEAAALKVPCVTLRYVTDRPESVQAGVNLLAPPKNIRTILKAIAKADKNNAAMRKKNNPYGKGNSSKLIIDAIEKFEGKLIQWEHEKR